MGVDGLIRMEEKAESEPTKQQSRVTGILSRSLKKRRLREKRFNRKLGPTFTYSQRSRWMKMEKPL
jgi:hypothetical protein